MDNAPSIILIAPQLGENIGAAARAMHNFGVSDLRLVNPRDGWPNREAVDVARNAVSIIDNVKIYSSVKEAVADIHFLYATTARPRDMVKTVLTPRRCAKNLRRYANANQKCGIMFGPERTGMSNDDIVLADSIVTIPVSELNTSLNLAQAVSVLCYEWFVSGDIIADETFVIGESLPATKSEITMLLENLECELDNCGFFSNPDMRQRMLLNLSNIFTRNNLSQQEVKTLRGVVRRLVGKYEQ